MHGVVSFIIVLTLIILQGSLGEPHDYDLIVIGGSCDGLAAAREASTKYGKKVLVVDYISPSYRETEDRKQGSWSDEGRVSTKLMHQAYLMGEAVKEADNYGWEMEPPNTVNVNLIWSTVTTALENRVKSINEALKDHLKKEALEKVDYVYGTGEFVDKNAIKVTEVDMKIGISDKSSAKSHLVTADKVLIAVGMRPNYPNIKGAKDYGITIDGLLSQKDPPGKTLIIGAHNTGLEYAGFLRGMGVDVTVMVKSKQVLLGFDIQMADMIKEDLTSKGVSFIFDAELVSIVKKFLQCCKVFGCIFFKKGKRLVAWKNKDKNTEVGTWDTVLIAIGQHAITDELNLQSVGITVEENGKLKAQMEQAAENIYVIGDTLNSMPELTLGAIPAAKLLMARLYGDSQVGHHNMPTTLYTPLEYSFVGLSEEDAVNEYTIHNIEVYHALYKPTEFAIPHKDSSHCYLKVICTKSGDQKILGMHFMGPTANIVMEGYAAAIKAGLTFKQLQDTVGIHPTVSEEFTRVYITKSSGVDPTPQSCCS